VKGERYLYFEGDAVVSVIMCCKWNGLRWGLKWVGKVGREGIVAPHVADLRYYRQEIGASRTADVQN